MAELAITTEIMLPLLILLGLGVLMNRIGWFPTQIAAGVNKLVFKLLLPVLLFNNLRSMTFSDLSGVGYPLFLFISLMAVFLLAQFLVPVFEKDPRKKGVMVQGIFRSNFAILGIPLSEAMFGTLGVTVYSIALPIIVPLNNILAVITLSSSTGKKADIRKLLLDILKNPLIIGCALGAIFLFCHIQLPSVLDDCLNRIGGITSTLSLLVLGANLRWEGVRNNKKQLLWTVLLKQFIIPAVMMALAILLGFHGAELAVIVILYGAPDAVSSFPMADAMGGDRDLAAGQVVLTTVFSMGSLFLMIFIGKLLKVL